VNFSVGYSNLISKGTFHSPLRKHKIILDKKLGLTYLNGAYDFMDVSHFLYVPKYFYLNLRTRRKATFGGRILAVYSSFKMIK